MDQEIKAMDDTAFWDDPNAAGPPIDPVSFVAVFLRRWPFILTMSVLGLGLAYAASYLVTPTFTSKAVFLPPTQAAATADNALALILRPPSSNIYIGLLTSDSVLQDVVDKDGLQAIYKAKDAEGARNSLRSATGVSSDANGFVTLDVTDKDPRLAQTIATTYLQALSHLSDRLAISEASQRKALFQSELERTKNDLEASEIALKKAQEASGVVSADSQIRSGLSAIDVAQADIRAKRVALAALLEGQTEQSPEVQRYRSEIATEEGQLARLESGGGAPQGAGISAAQAPGVALRFVQLEREVKYNQVLFDIMARQFENAKLQESSAAPGVQVVDFPELPLRKSKPSRRAFALAGLFISFLASLILVFLRNRLEVMRADPERARSLDLLRDSLRSAKLKA